MTDAFADARTRLRRSSGRVLWVVAAATAAWLGLDVGGAVVAPALVDVRISRLPSPSTAVVKAVRVRSGDDVHAGDVLVELDGTALDLELALAQAELERVRGTVRARQVDVKDQDFEVGLRLQADLDKATLSEATTAAALKQDERELESLAALVEKNDRLVKEQLASAGSVDELRVRQASLTERVASARQELRTAQQLKQTAERRAADWRARSGHEDALLAPDAAAVLAQDERVKLARWRRDQLTIRAPFSGRVGDVEADVGDPVAEGAALVSLVDTVPTEATAWVGEEDAWRVGVGDVVTLRSIDGRAAVRRGIVRALGGGIVEVPVRLRPIPGEAAFGRPVHLDLSPEGPVVIAGQTFEASFAAASSSSVSSSSVSSSSVSSSSVSSSVAGAPSSAPVARP